MNSFGIKKDMLLDYLFNNHFLYQFVNKFSELLLLCKEKLCLIGCKFGYKWLKKWENNVIH